jgi:hypothetical protein
MAYVTWADCLLTLPVVKTGIIVWEAAMNLYEKIMLALAVITLIYNIFSDLLHKRKKGEE